MPHANVFDEAANKSVSAIVDQAVEFAINVPQEVFEVILLARALHNQLTYVVDCGKELEEEGIAPVVNADNVGHVDLNLAEVVFIDCVDFESTYNQMSQKYGVDMLKYFRYRRSVDDGKVEYVVDNSGPRSRLKV